METHHFNNLDTNNVLCDGSSSLEESRSIDFRLCMGQSQPLKRYPERLANHQQGRIIISTGGHTKTTNA
jgi:hypothetical protein